MRRHRHNPTLRRVDAAYLASLLVPLALYGIGLKAAGSAGEAGDLAAFFSLVRSDLLFYAGYALLWVGIFILARSGRPRRAAVIGLHAVSLVVVALATFAYQYFESTGTTMDFAVISFYITTLGEIARVVAGSTPWYAWVVLAAAVAYVLAGPAVVLRLAWRLSRTEGRAYGDGARERVPVRSVATGLGLMAIGLLSMSFFPGTVDANRSYSLTPVANVLMSSVAAGEQARLSSEALQS